MSEIMLTGILRAPHSHDDPIAMTQLIGAALAAADLIDEQSAKIALLQSDLADVRRWHAECGQVREGWDNMAEFFEETGQQAAFEEWARKTGRIIDAKAS